MRKTLLIVCSTSAVAVLGIAIRDLRVEPCDRWTTFVAAELVRWVDDDHDELEQAYPRSTDPAVGEVLKGRRPTFAGAAES